MKLNASNGYTETSEVFDMTNETKCVFGYFTIADWEREQNWLTEMAAQGWRFVKTNGFFYTFERCEPENVVYRLDYSGLRKGDRGDYYAMLRDYGWEYLQDINGFSYFRKPADGVSQADLDIFSDGESRIKWLKNSSFQRCRLFICCLSRSCS